ncbi:MAG: hypothetical protein GF329_17555 [Candidatus Lokiarchaeota archaeon]|nr:hypothetical protein [Candidatus Lokiarchaeota archaeon]
MKLIDSDKECKECGECVRVCPLSEVDSDFIVYKIFFEEQNGLNFWERCCSCFLCEENCPYNLSPREEIFSKRRESQDLEVPKTIDTYYKKIMEIGFAFNINEDINDIRSELDLPKLALRRIKKEINQIIHKK